MENWFDEKVTFFKLYYRKYDSFGFVLSEMINRKMKYDEIFCVRDFKWKFDLFVYLIFLLDKFF